MSATKKSLMIVSGEHGPPSLEDAAEQLAVKPDAIDRNFGVVPLDPKLHTYSVLVELPRDRDRRGFSNPKIEPFKP